MTTVLNGLKDEDVNGLDASPNYDAESSRAGLFASSTKRRISELHSLNEQLLKQGR